MLSQDEITLIIVGTIFIVMSIGMMIFLLVTREKFTHTRSGKSIVDIVREKLQAVEKDSDNK